MKIRHFFAQLRSFLYLSATLDIFIRWRSTWLFRNKIWKRRWQELVFVYAGFAIEQQTIWCDKCVESSKISVYDCSKQVPLYYCNKQTRPCLSWLAASVLMLMLLFLIIWTYFPVNYLSFSLPLLLCGENESPVVLESNTVELLQNLTWSKMQCRGCQSSLQCFCGNEIKCWMRKQYSAQYKYIEVFLCVSWSFWQMFGQIFTSFSTSSLVPFLQWCEGVCMGLWDCVPSSVKPYTDWAI